jgi:CRP-like cAMP-binding protein
MAEVKITPKALQERFPRLLARLDLDEINILLGFLAIREVSPGSVLYRNGDHSDVMYFLWQGRMSLSLQLANEERVLGNLEPGQFIGVSGVIEPGPALLKVQAVEPSLLLCLDHAALKQLRAAHPGLGSKVLQALSLDLVQWLRGYEDYMTERAEPDSIEVFFRIGRLDHHIS